MLCPPYRTLPQPLESHATGFSIPRESRLTQEKVPDEAPNHLARGQSAAAGLTFQRHRLVSRQQHGQLDHFFIQRVDLLSWDFLWLGWLRLHKLLPRINRGRASPRTTVRGLRFLSESK